MELEDRREGWPWWSQMLQLIGGLIAWAAVRAAEENGAGPLAWAGAGALAGAFLPTLLCAIVAQSGISRSSWTEWYLLLDVRTVVGLSVRGAAVGAVGALIGRLVGGVANGVVQAVTALSLFVYLRFIAPVGRGR